MLHASTQKLIVTLYALTEAGEIAWKEGERETAILETEGYTVEVRGDPPTIRLLRSDGRELERADPSDLADIPWPGSQDTFAARVTALAASANRIARGAELAISKILTSLSAPPKSTAEPGQPDARIAPPALASENPEADTAVERALAFQPEATHSESPRSEPLKPTPLAAATAIHAGEPAAIDARPEPAPEIDAVDSGRGVLVVDSEAVSEITRFDEARAIEAGPEIALRPALVPAQTEETLLEESLPDPSEEPAARPEAGPGRGGKVFGATASFAQTSRPASVTMSASPAFAGGGKTSPTRSEPILSPAPAPAAKPASAQSALERMPEPVGAGPDIYKPWS